MRRAILFTEWGESIGLGHLRRCEALKDHLEARGFAAQIRANVNPMICADLKRFEIAVIDSYQLPLEAYEWVSERVKRAIFFDDTLRLDYPKGVILNAAMGAESLPYTPKEGRELWLGKEYALVRKEFWNRPKKSISPKIQSLLLTLGGSALGAEAQRRIEALLRERFPALEILTLAPSQNPSAAEIVAKMRRADIALSASGGTLYELAACGVPTIALKLVENQRHSFEGWKSLGAVIEAHLENLDSILAGVETLQDPAHRQALSLQAQAIMKGATWEALSKMTTR